MNAKNRPQTQYTRLPHQKLERDPSKDYKPSNKIYDSYEEFVNAYYESEEMIIRQDARYSNETTAFFKEDDIYPFAYYCYGTLKKLDADFNLISGIYIRDDIKQPE